MKVGMYYHAGSKNHGCEAIVRATTKILENKECEVYSIRKEDDYAYSLNLCCPVKGNWLERNFFFKWLWLSLGSKFGVVRKEEKAFFYTLHGDYDIGLSIGGDNYCYSGQPEQLAYLNKKLKERGKKTVLWGCSIEPEVLQEEAVVEDLKSYDLITVRESMTREALEKVGITSNVKQFADPAFQLDADELPLPKGFALGNTIGINLSPLICRYENRQGKTYANYEKLIEYILNETTYHIALIPHVVVDGNDDREAMMPLYEKYQETGRVTMLGDYNCQQIKGFIGRCQLFIGARTHATIAAYSSGVPTLVVGYSIKARGIAKDLFGEEDHYVLPVQKIQEENDLVHEFQWLMENEQMIRERLNEILPSYIESAKLAGTEI